MFAKVGLLLCFVVACNCAYIETIERCELQDEVCSRTSLTKVIKDLSASGLPELGIPPLDPLAIKELSVPILNVLDFTLYDAVVKGFKKCIINKNSVNIESKHGILDITCDLTVKGRYKARSTSDAFTALFGGDSIHGEGKGKVKIEKLHILFDFNFDLESRDGEIYIVDRDQKLNAKYEVLGRMVFAADNLYVGDVESSKVITDFLNQNWRDLFASFGSVVMDRAMEFVHDTVRNFYNRVPTRYFIKDNLEPYLSH